MNKKNKIVVLVGSLKFWDKIQEMHEKLEKTRITRICSYWNNTTCNGKKLYKRRRGFIR